MPYVAPEVVQRVKQIDLLTYLKNYEPYELVHFSGNVYTTRSHDSLKMKRFSQMHKNYHIEENKSPAFRHIQILIHEGSWAIVSKEKTPAIHFVIRHPKMREAMENITMPIVEGEEYK